MNLTGAGASRTTTDIDPKVEPLPDLVLAEPEPGSMIGELLLGTTTEAIGDMAAMVPTSGQPT